MSKELRTLLAPILRRRKDSDQGPSAAEEEIETQSLRTEIERILKAHGLTTMARGQWLLVAGKMPAVAATALDYHEFKMGCTIQVDVQVALDKERIIVESFGGAGSTRKEAIGDALYKFCASSLHVFCAAFWGQVPDDQVTIESWKIADDHWKVIIGGVSTYSKSQTTIVLPGDLFPTIESLLKGLTLTGNVNWVSTFYGNPGIGKPVCEVLVNNETHESGRETISKLNWPESKEFYSVRNFLILLRER